MSFFYSNDTVRPEFSQRAVNEKKGIKKAANKIGFAGLALFLGTGLWTVFCRIFYELGKGFHFDAQKILSEPAILQCVQIALSILCFVLPTYLILASEGKRADEVIPFGKPKKGTFWPFLLIGVGFCSLVNIADSYAGRFFENIGFEYSVDMGEDPSGLFGTVLVIISTAVVPPLVEELGTRGIMMGLLKKFGDGFSIVCTAAIFGLMHGNFEQIPFAFCVGLLLGYARIKTGSIWTCITIHAINNLVAIISGWMYNTLEIYLSSAVDTLYIAASLVLSLIGVLLLVRKGETFTLKKPTTALGEKKKYAGFFSTPSVIIFIVIALFSSVNYFV